MSGTVQDKCDMTEKMLKATLRPETTTTRNICAFFKLTCVGWHTYDQSLIMSSASAQSVLSLLFAVLNTTEKFWFVQKIKN